jgi:peptide/nickel transport system permease protein
MAGFLLRRLLYLVCLVVIATSASYFLAATQLNPRARYEGRNPPPPPAVVDATLDQLNMNDKVPVLTRYQRWAGGLLRGNLGQTIDNQPVNDEIGRRMWVSLRLVLMGALVGTVLGVAAGAYGAVKQYQFSDRLLTIFSFVTLSIPAVVLGVLFKNAGIGINNLLGFRLLYTTGEMTPARPGPGRAANRWHILLPCLSVAF